METELIVAHEKLLSDEVGEAVEHCLRCSCLLTSLGEGISQLREGGIRTEVFQRVSLNLRVTSQNEVFIVTEVFKRRWRSDEVFGLPLL